MRTLVTDALVDPDPAAEVNQKPPAAGSERVGGADIESF
jgi:hypothetical protein